MFSSGMVIYFLIHFLTLLIEPRIFYIPIDSLLNIFSSSFLHLPQIIERTIVYSKRYDIVGFSRLTAINAI